MAFGKKLGIERFRLNCLLLVREWLLMVASLTCQKKRCQMTATYWLIHHAVKLSILPVKPFATRNVKHERVTVQSAGPFLWTRRFCLYAMESAAVYLGVRFGTGRGGSAEVI